MAEAVEPAGGAGPGSALFGFGYLMAAGEHGPTDLDPAKAADLDPAEAADLRQWARDRRIFEHSRLDRVQAAARVWLGVLTTLIGLAGSVVLVKGNTLLTDLTSSLAFQWVLGCLIALGFLFAILAIISGAAASWGGLSAVGHGEQPRWRKAAFKLILLFAFDREKLPEHGNYAASDKAAGEYKDQYQQAAVSRRNLLQASRALGVVAAATIAILAVVILLAGAVAPAPTDVIVIHGGRATCEPVSAAQQETSVTRIVPVSQC